MDNGQYDDHALLYRDILSYPIKKASEKGHNNVQNNNKNANSVTFTRWQTATWLRSNHSIYVTRYRNKPLRYRTEEIESIQKTIKRNLDRLVEIELLQIIGSEKIQTGTGNTPIYKHTIFGLLIAWIIEYQNICDTEIGDVEKYQDRRKIANDEIYSVLQDILKKGKRYAPSTFVLYSKFFEICKEQNLFGNLIQLMNEILRLEEDMITMENFIHRLMEFDFKSENSKLLFRLILWNGTLNSLDERTRNVFLHNAKLDIERKVVEGLKNLRGYESLMLKALEYPKIQVILECNCNCKQCRSYILRMLDVRKYKIRMILANIDSSELSGVALQIYKLEMDKVCSNIDPFILPEKCPACNTHNSLKIPFFTN